MWWPALHSHKLHWDSWGDNQPPHDIKFLRSLFVKIIAVACLQQNKINNNTPAGQNPKEELSKPARGQQLVFSAATGHEWYQKTCLRDTGSQRTKGTESEQEKIMVTNKAWWRTHTEGSEKQHKLMQFSWQAVCQTQWIKILLPVYWLWANAIILTAEYSSSYFPWVHWQSWQNELFML